MVSFSLKVAGGFWLIFRMMLTIFPVKVVREVDKIMMGNTQLFRNFFSDLKFQITNFPQKNILKVNFTTHRVHLSDKSICCEC
jgi:hypothetical protein